MTGRRTVSGGSAIDRAMPISFTFDGEGVAAFSGDTIASAEPPASRPGAGLSTPSRASVFASANIASLIQTRTHA